MNKLNRKEISKGIYFNNVHDNRFKTMRISATIFVPLQYDTAALNALVCKVLTRSSAEYPESNLLARHLSGLYGATLSSNIVKMGDVQVLTISVTGLDDKYVLNNEKMSEELSRFLCSIIFSPKLINNEFDINELNQEKRQLLDLADSEFNDKRVYSNTRAIEVMCKDEVFGTNRYGTKEQIEKATTKDLFKAWENLLKTATFNFMYIGDSESDNIYKIFKNSFKNIKREPTDLNIEVIKTVQKVKTEEEIMDLAQSKLIMGFRTVIAEPDKDVMAMRLMSWVLGGGATSKLFKNVREKLSLCYYCLGRYDRLKGILLIESGVEKENIEKAKTAILKEVENIKKGEITDFEIETAKLSINNFFKGSGDTVSGLENWYISQLLDKEIISANEMIDKIKKVSKDDVIKVAQNIKLDTVYTLESE